MSRRRVAVAVTEETPVFELAIPWDVFGRPRPGMSEPLYDLRLCLPTGSAVRTAGGFTIEGTTGYDLFASADLVIVLPPRSVEEEPPAELVAALRAAHRDGVRVASLCTGAFVLAAAGLLDGRRATTHWYYAEELARRYPAVTVDPNVLYVDEGSVLTSGGSTAGIDLCLHVVRRDYGAAAAARIARRLVAPPHRDGERAQLIQVPVPESADEGLDHLLEWMIENLDQPITVRMLAGRENLSERTLLRRFATATGTTPIQWLTQQRVLRAQQLLQLSNLSLDRIATEVGYGSPVSLRKHFTASVGVSPSAYRRSFAGP